MELLKGVYANPETVFSKLHPDFMLYSPGQNLIAGVFHGAEGMKAHFEQMDAMTSNTLTHNLTGTYLADGGWGMVVHRLTAQRNGKALDTQGFGLWQFKDGLLSGHWESVGDQAHWDDFWS
ncbi:nuclear transport factor 2 family protein [Novosphingobium beihaiensis]|uniref:Nuclear transport factor 2 family protein n=1 Tax=Novosphingobium beihaiensis TaxID=2930389 RepID=A0ABT0BUV3_9SPHN|nr:nuclear transport factor 2 family protein [Novosphingobium beihaiensis]MCJ2188444.1 nuclear transport factor 2 family protein [Novosphingobium beihaiensis]